MNLEREGGGKESNTPKCVQKVQEGSRQGSARMPHRMIMVSVREQVRLMTNSRKAQLSSVVCSPLFVLNNLPREAAGVEQRPGATGTRWTRLKVHSASQLGASGLHLPKITFTPSPSRQNGAF